MKYSARQHKYYIDFPAEDHFPQTLPCRQHETKINPKANKKVLLHLLFQSSSLH